MTVPDELLLRVVWGARQESPDALTERTHAMLDLLAGLGGALSEPLWSTTIPLVQVTGDREALSRLVLSGFDRDDATGEVFWATGTSFGLLQHPLALKADGRASVHIRVSAGNARPTRSVASNQILVEFRPGTEGVFPDEVLRSAHHLVREMVRIWEPDAVSLDSLEILRAQRSRGVPLPTIGYVTWLTPEVMRDATSLPEFSLHEPTDGGTLLAVDLGSPTLVEDTFAMIDRVLTAEILAPIPPAASHAAT